MSNLIFRAQEFARAAHAHIMRETISGVKCPQILHIQEVADLVWASGGTDEEIAAAWLHDAVEDTSVKIEDIEKTFGKRVSEIVHGLTDSNEISGLPILERKTRQSHRIKHEDNQIKRIKIADQTSNVRFLAKDPPTTMSKEDCIEYIEGARLIAVQCKGVSQLLDKLFAEAYTKANLRYNHK